MIQKDASFIVLYSSKIPETKTFFESLSCEIIEYEPEKCVVRFGSHELHYVTSEPIKAYAFISDQQSESKGLILYAEVDSLVGLPETVVQNGGSLLSEVVTTPWDTQEFLFNDPNGYHFVLYQ